MKVIVKVPLVLGNGQSFNAGERIEVSKIDGSSLIKANLAAPLPESRIEKTIKMEITEKRKK